MKIAYCLSCTCFPGGMEKIVIQKANWLAEHDYDIVIITTEQNGRPSFFEISSKIRCIDLGINYSSDLGKNIFIRYFLRRKKIQLHKRKLAFQLNIEKPDIIISTFGNEVEFLHKIETSGKKMLEIHFSRWFRLQIKTSFLHHLYNKFLTYRDYNLVKCFDAFVTLTQEDKNNWGNINNLYVIPNFTDIIPLNKQINTQTAIAIGRLSYQKGLDRMIEAWQLVHKNYPSWKLKIFGSGELKRDLEYQIYKLGLKECVAIYPPSKQINQEMAQSEFLLLTSHFEGLPMVLIEGLRCGLPLISFDCQCGPLDIITPSNGILVKNNDVVGFANAIMSVIKEEDQRLKMAENAAQCGLNYTAAKIMPLWESIFKKLTSNKIE